MDSGSTSATGNYTITDAQHTVQIEWQAATAPGANNGSLKLSIDGQLKQTLSGKDNDTRQVDYIRLGAVAGIDSNTRGALYLDDFRSWDPTAVVQAQFHYDGDGRRVQSVVNGVTTAFIGQYLEWTGSTGSTDTASLTIPHTTSGTERLMLVGVSNLTYVGSETQNDDARVELWMLVAPPTGTHNVVITFSALSSA